MDRQQAIDIIARSDLVAHADVLGEHLLPSARLRVSAAADDRPDQGVSRLGGVPLLPRGADWPRWDRRFFLTQQIERLERDFRANPRATGLRDIARQMRRELGQGPVPLLFLGQLWLEELHAAAPLPAWPTDGSLAFFFDPSSWGFDPSARGCCLVFYFGPHVELSPAAVPADLPAAARYRPHRVRFEREWTLPSSFRERRPEWQDGDDAAYDEVRDRLRGETEDGAVIHRCGGHPEEIQHEMQVECQLVTNGIYCGGAEIDDPRRSALAAGAADWELLLQVDSDEERPGWMWGDSGRVYFWARRQDIAAADFAGAWAILQCN